MKKLKKLVYIGFAFVMLTSNLPVLAQTTIADEHVHTRMTCCSGSRISVESIKCSCGSRSKKYICEGCGSVQYVHGAPIANPSNSCNIR